MFAWRPVGRSGWPSEYTHRKRISYYERHRRRAWRHDEPRSSSPIAERSSMRISCGRSWARRRARRSDSVSCDVRREHPNMEAHSLSARTGSTRAAWTAGTRAPSSVAVASIATAAAHTAGRARSTRRGRVRRSGQPTMQRRDRRLCRQRQAMVAQHETDDVGPRGTERGSHAELPRAPAGRHDRQTQHRRATGGRSMRS